jgi:MFS-type transporter involved in bile tolerance (Atg22 family)
MLGPVQSYSRTVFSDLVIPGKEAEFFALYEITDKGRQGSFLIIKSDFTQCINNNEMQRSTVRNSST